MPATEFKTPSPVDWRQWVVQPRRRKDSALVRSWIDSLRPDEPSPLFDRLAHGQFARILAFLNCCPTDLTWLCTGSAEGQALAMCSHDLDRVRRLALYALGDRGIELPGVSENESWRTQRRRDQVAQAVGRVMDVVLVREDLRIVLAWHVSGDIAADCVSSPAVTDIDGLLNGFVKDVLDEPNSEPELTIRISDEPAALTELRRKLLL